MGEIKKYHFNGESYTATEIVKMGRSLSHDSEKHFRDSVDQWILAQILERGGLPRVAKKIEKIAEINQMIHSTLGYTNLSERKKASLNRSYVRRLDRFDASLDIHNCTLFLEHLIRSTFGPISAVPLEARDKDDWSIGIVDYFSMTDEQCAALAANFKRAMKRKPLVPAKGVDEKSL